MHINVELRDERGMALWILGVMFNNDKDELNLETSPVKHVEKVVQIFFFFLHKYSDQNNFLLEGFCRLLLLWVFVLFCCFFVFEGGLL